MESIRIRKAKTDDLMLFFKWANDALVRKNSISTNTININDHYKWFHGKLKSKDSIMLIMEVNGDSVGQVRFDLVENKAIINYSVDCEYRGKGYGTLLIELGIERLLKRK